MRPVSARLLVNALAALSLPVALPLNNGRAVTPPMGWRSWNLLGGNVDQEIITSMMTGMATKVMVVNGVPTSLADLGYRDVGLDDAWQLCGSYGAAAYTYHNQSGYPQVNFERFPNFAAMTAYAASLNLTAGWYHNNCDCSDHCSLPECYAGDVSAASAFGFSSMKFDNCGAETNLDLYASLLNATGTAFLVENCHWGDTVPNATWCPFSYYRTSGDIEASYSAMMNNLMTVPQFASKGLSGPNCWAYPDMLEVGVVDGVHGASGDPGLSPQETRTHFGAWCVVSSPLVLSHDISNASITAALWPVIGNQVALSVSQAWAGFSGSLFASSTTPISLSGGPTVGVWQAWFKPLNATSTAVLLINHAAVAATVPLSFNAIPGTPCQLSCSVYDVWAQAPLGVFSSTFTSPLLAPHDSAFLIVSAVTPPPAGGVVRAVLTVASGDYCLDFWEMQLFDVNGRNVVGGAITTAPVTGYGGYLAAANDYQSYPYGGYPSGTWMFHAGCDASDYFAALFAPAQLTTLILHNREDCCTSRPYSDGYTLTLYNSQGAVVSAVNFTALGLAATSATVLVVNLGGVAGPATPVFPPAGDSLQLAMAAAWVRYVRIYAPAGSAGISLREVQVFDVNHVNVALHKPCSASASALPSLTCGLALDHVIQFDNSSSLSNAFVSPAATVQAPQWWLVDLGGVYDVANILVYSVYNSSLSGGGPAAQALSGAVLTLLNAANGTVNLAALAGGAIQTLQFSLPVLTPSATITPSNSPSSTPSGTLTSSITPSSSASVSFGATPTATQSGTPSESGTQTGTPTATQTPAFPSHVQVLATGVFLNFMEVLVFNTAGQVISYNGAGALSASQFAPAYAVAQTSSAWEAAQGASDASDLCMDIAASGALMSCNPFSSGTGTGMQWANITFAAAAPQAVGAVYFVNRQDPSCGGSCGLRITAGAGVMTLNRADGSLLASYLLGSGAVTQAHVSPIVLPPPRFPVNTSNASAQSTLVRYVLVQAPVGSYFNFKELLVLDDSLTNVALGKPATVSTQYVGDTSNGQPCVYTASMGNDGNIDDDTGCSNVVNAAGTAGWWQVDLQGLYNVVQVVMFNRGPAGSSNTLRMAGAVATLSNGNGTIIGTITLTSALIQSYPVVLTPPVPSVTAPPAPSITAAPPSPAVTLSPTQSLPASTTPTESATAVATQTRTASSSPTASSSGSRTVSATGTSSSSGTWTASVSGTSSYSGSKTAPLTHSTTATPALSQSLPASTTGTATSTHSPTGSNSPSTTSLPTHSPTGSSSLSGTHSAAVTPSWTVSTTASPTASVTASLTQSLVQSSTATPSGSASNSPPSTPGSSQSLTMSRTFTKTSSLTGSVSATASNTRTGTATTSESRTGTRTPRATHSSSPSGSASGSGSSSNSPSVTLSSTVTRSESMSHTGSASSTAASTASPSRSPTSSQTSSTTPSGSATSSGSSAPTVSASITFTSTATGSRVSHSPTPSKTPTRTPTASRTSSRSLSSTPSFSRSPTSSKTSSRSITASHSPVSASASRKPK